MARGYETPWSTSCILRVNVVIAGQGIPLTAQVERAGPYRIQGILGEGGMGVVHRAVHEETGAVVAVKLLRHADANLVAAFRREVFALRNVEHPGVVRIVDDGVEGGLPWYAMELLAGVTLRDRIDGLHGLHGGDRWSTAALTDTASHDRLSEAPPPLHERATLPPGPPVDRLQPMLTILRCICETLAHLHGGGIVHRDLKPSNVFLQHDEPILVDFGLARAVALDAGREVLDDTPGPRGTPAYMAPEQIRGEMVDARTDLYAIGCILFECITGEPPFEGGTVSMLRRHLSETPPDLAPYPVDDELAALVRSLLAKRPRERLGHALDVARVLERCGAAPPHHAGPAPRPYLHRPGLAGRRDELDALCDAALHPPFSPLVLIGGQSGTGKTRLAAELTRRAGHLGRRVITGRAEDRGQAAAPLHPFRELLRAIADLARAHPSFGLEILGEDGPLLATYEPTLRALPGLAGPLPVATEALRLRTAFTAVLRRFAEAQPLLLVIDDLQWADPLSDSLLIHLASTPIDAPLVVVGSYRSEERTAAIDELLAVDGTFALDLGPLGDDAVADMMCDMLALDEVPAPLLQPLLREAEGNPFFVTEYLRLALERDLLARREDGHWEPRLEATWDELPVPDGLLELVARRYERLGDAARRLVDAASALGRVFTAEVAVAAAGLEELASRQALDQLRERGWLEEAPRGQVRFVHDKLHELTYERLTAQERRALHGRIAVALEASVADDLDRHSAELARHFEAASDLPTALDYLERAGTYALAVAASEDARRHFGHALDLADPTVVAQKRLARWHRGLGEACYNLGLLRDAEHHLQRSLVQMVREVDLEGWLRLTQEAFRPSWRSSRLAQHDRERLRAVATTLQHLARVHYFLHHQEASFAAAVASVPTAALLGPSPERARSLATLGVALGMIPGVRRLSGHLQRADRIARTVGDGEALAFVRYQVGFAHLNEGHLPEARAALAEALVQLQELGLVRMTHETLALIGSASSLAGDLTEARQRFAHLRDVAVRVGDGQARVWALAGEANASLRAGELEQSLAAFDQCTAANPDTADAAQRIADGGRALALLELGRIDDARAVAREVVEMAAASSPVAFHIAFGTSAACEVLLWQWERHRAPAARNLAHAAIAQHVRLARSFPVARPTATIFRGWACLLDGQRWRGRRLLQHASHQAEACGMRIERLRARYELARFSEAGAARSATLRAIATGFDRWGAHLWRRRVEQALEATSPTGG